MAQLLPGPALNVYHAALYRSVQQKIMILQLKSRRGGNYTRWLHEMLFWQKTQCRGCVWAARGDPLSSPDPRTLRAYQRI